MKVKRVVVVDFWGCETTHDLASVDTFGCRHGDDAFEVSIRGGVLRIEQHHPTADLDDRTLKAYAERRFGKLMRPL